jgi:hypothetical protein
LIPCLEEDKGMFPNLVGELTLAGANEPPSISPGPPVVLLDPSPVLLSRLLLLSCSPWDLPKTLGGWQHAGHLGYQPPQQGDSNCFLGSRAAMIRSCCPLVASPGMRSKTEFLTNNKQKTLLKNSKCCQAPVAHACNPSDSGGRDQEDHGSKPSWVNSS